VHQSVAQALTIIGAPAGLFDDGGASGPGAMGSPPASVHASPVSVRTRTTIGVPTSMNDTNNNAIVTMTHIDDVSVSFNERPAGPLFGDHTSSSMMTPSMTPTIPVPQRSPNRVGSMPPYLFAGYHR
jgi:hypothetical protein